MASSFDFELIEEFKGYNSAFDKTRLDPGFMIRGSKNVYKKITGTVASRNGLKRRGQADSTDAGVKSSYEWATNLGTTRIIRVCNGKLEVESDIVNEGTFEWYELRATSTLASLAGDLSRFVFDTWWDDEEKSDRLLMVRGDDKMLHWSGGIALVESGTAEVAGGIDSNAINSGGTGYEVGDILTVSGGDGNATIEVLVVNGSGVITDATRNNPGSGYSVNTGISLTGGTGSGATLDISSLASYATITKQGDLSWAELGFATILSAEKKIIIDGREATYIGGEDTTTLYGVIMSSGSASTLSSGMLAIQSVMVADSTPVEGFLADFIKTINNQVWVGSYKSRVVYISADVTVDGDLGFLNFTNSGDIVSGDPDKVVMDSQGRGIGVKDGKVILFAGDSDMYIVTPNLNVATSYSFDGTNDRFVFQSIEKKQLAGLTAALGHEFIGNISGYLVWIDQRNQLRALGTFSGIDTIKPVHLSLAVQGELSEDDFTDGHLKIISDTIHITAPNTGRDWMYQMRETVNNNGVVFSENIWQPPQVRGIARFAVIGGARYGHSNVNPQLYQVDNTAQWYDDNPNDEMIPYTSVARFAYRSHGRREGLISFSKIYFEGYTNKGVNLMGNIYFDYKGFDNEGTASVGSIVINSEDDQAEFWGGTRPISIGNYALGDNPLGDGIIEESDDQELLPKFRAAPSIEQKGGFFEYSVEVYSEDEDSRWELITLGPDTVVSKGVPAFISK